MASISQLTLGVFRDDPQTALDVALARLDHPHPRAGIRRWIRDRLRAAALQPARIRVTRAIPTPSDDLPGVFIYTLQENEPEEFSREPLVYERPLEVAIHVAIAEDQLPPDTDLDDVLDAFADVFESVLLLDHNDRGQFFGEQAAACALGSSEFTPEPAGARVIMHSRLALRVTYQRPVVRAGGVKLQIIHANWDLGPPDHRIDAEDRVLLPVHCALDARIELEAELLGTAEP